MILASACLATLVVTQPAALAGPCVEASGPGAIGQATTPPRVASPPAKKPEAPPPQAGQLAPPGEAELGVKVYPTAEFVGAFDAGRGQRYYLFGTSATFADLVAFYRTVLKNRGELVYEQPLVHMFDTGRFREETMAFPPSVTIKDYTSGGSQGYLHALPGGQSKRYPTIIQIVPVPPGERR